jgi:hypothetical protein
MSEVVYAIHAIPLLSLELWYVEIESCEGLLSVTVKPYAVLS